MVDFFFFEKSWLIIFLENRIDPMAIIVDND
jgi:hypothetical protein